MPTRSSSRKPITLARWQRELIDRRARKYRRDPDGYFTLPQFRKLMAMLKKELKRRQAARRQMDKVAAKMVRDNRRANRRPE